MVDTPCACSAVQSSRTLRCSADEWSGNITISRWLNTIALTIVFRKPPATRACSACPYIMCVCLGFKTTTAHAHPSIRCDGSATFVQPCFRRGTSIAARTTFRHAAHLASRFWSDDCRLLTIDMMTL